MHKGLLIAFEGIDGSGLTTHSKLIVERLGQDGLRAVYTKEPTEGPIGRIIRSLLSINHSNHDIMALLFAADRLWHYRVDPSLPGGGIKGAIENGYLVVTDRYKYSSMAYQGSYLGIEWVDIVNIRAPEADILVYIDVPPEVSMRRIRLRGSEELYETRERLTLIKNTFENVLRLAESRGVKVLRVNAAGPDWEKNIEEVHEEIYKLLSQALNSLLRD